MHASTHHHGHGHGRHGKRRDVTADPEYARLLSELALDVKTEILDLGCGTGELTLALATRVGAVTAVDVDLKSLSELKAEQAKLGLTNISASVMDAGSLELPEASFDRVVCRYASHHFPDVERVVREIARVTKPGGKLVIQDAISSDIPSVDAFRTKVGKLRDATYVDTLTPDQWQALFAKHGFALAGCHQYKETRTVAGWYRLDFLSTARRQEIAETLLAAPPEIRDYLSIRVRNGIPFRFTDDKAILTAERLRAQ